MGEGLEKKLDKDAGRIIYFHKVSGEQFIEKAWRVCLELNGEWARRALALDFKRVSLAFRRRRYKEGMFLPVPDFIHFSKHGDSIYVFDPKEGGLVKDISQLACDYTVDPRTADIFPYYDTNTDTRGMQDMLIEEILEYVRIINGLLA